MSKDINQKKSPALNPKYPPGGRPSRRRARAGVNWANPSVEAEEKTAQTITFSPPAYKTVGDEAFEISATASSGLAVTLAVISGPATLEDGTVTLTGEVGTVVLRATQAGDDTYAAACFVTRRISVLAAPKTAQTITFDPPAYKTVDDEAFAISATASSGLAVSIALISGPATLDDGTVTLTGEVGTVVLRATQAGDATYAPACLVEMWIPVVEAAEEDYVAPAVVFDGTNDYLTRGADFTGNSDGKKGTISFWFRLDGGDGAAQAVIRGEGLNFWVQRQTDNKWRINGQNAANATILTLNSTSAFTTSATWHHFLASWDLATGAGFLYIDDVDDLAASPTLTDDTLDYTDTNWGVGSTVAGTLKYNGGIADINANFSEHIDLSVEANRRKFISATGKPVYLGANGELPTGTAPILFLSGDATDFHTNKGTGGGMTVTGALADSDTSPSDP